MLAPIVLVLAIPCLTAAPLEDILDARSSKRIYETTQLPSDLETPASNDVLIEKFVKKPSERSPGIFKSSKRTPSPTDEPRDSVEPDGQQGRPKVKPEKKLGRKHKALFVNYPFLPRITRYPSVPTYDAGYGADYDARVDQRTSGNRYRESEIFYIRLPPTPYTYVPGLGYISQPPKYSTAGLLPQTSPARPVRRKPNPTYQRPSGDPFIKLPIDFVSNGKPTSVYQWQKRPSKRPTDSPITNLDGLSSDFVSNGKPTTIYQWQSNGKPIGGPDEGLDATGDVLNSLDKGPYAFNGRPSSVYLLGPDGSTSAHQPIRYTDYQDVSQDSAYY